MANKQKGRKRPPEGRVNIPLGHHEATLAEQAAKAETSKTALARILVLDGLKRLVSGECVLKEPGLEVSA